VRAREDPQDREAGSSGRVLRQGRLSLSEEDRAAGSAARSSPTLYRLKRSLQPLYSRDGNLYLLRNGQGGDFVISEPSPIDRAAINLLGQSSQSHETLAAALEAQGLHAERAELILSDLAAAGVVEEVSELSRLSREQLERYDRQLIYFSDLAPRGIAAESMQATLAHATVGVLGCGGLGSWVASGLACAGVGRLVLVDDDRVEQSNLNRQILFTEEDVGRLKIDAAAERLRRSNRQLKIDSITRRVTSPGDMDFAADVDLLISTADWPPYELPRWINDACSRFVTPYLTAGQVLPKIRVGPLVVPGETACNECIERYARRAYPLYEELSSVDPSDLPPAATLGAASGVAGSLLAMEAVHFLTGVRPATHDACFVVDLKTFRATREPVARDPGCLACQRARHRVRARREHDAAAAASWLTAQGALAHGSVSI
jgi:molybdopterin-synthase adenylyltransferase